MKLHDIYHFVRKFLFEIMLYFFLQGLLLIALGILIILYPYVLNLLVALGFFATAIISLYIMVRVGKIFHDVKKIGRFLRK